MTDSLAEPRRQPDDGFGAAGQAGCDLPSSGEGDRLPVKNEAGSAISSEFSELAHPDALRRLTGLVHRLRNECPWDHDQTHRSLVKHLIEEVGECVDAIEAGDDRDLVEELGDVILQVVFHAEIASEQGRFSIDDVADGVVAKLVARHPYVYADEQIPDDLGSSWERRKNQAKNRHSCLDGIAEHLSSVADTYKVVSRAQSHGIDPIDAMRTLAGGDLEVNAVLDRVENAGMEEDGFGSQSSSRDARSLGDQMVGLIMLAMRRGFDPDQVLRDATRRLRASILETEKTEVEGVSTLGVDG